jgi:hypothetical protein
MKRFICLWIAGAIVSGAAMAQQPNPVVENYHAYMTALQRGDRAGAEAPAAAALAASQARDGDNGRTAVLALNLARLRVELSKFADALPPGTLAASVAQTQGGASGVDLVLAQIVLGRAELGAGNRNAGDHLRAALLAANGRRDLDEDAFAAATELGRWAHTVARYDVMRVAYESAFDHVAGAPGDAPLAHGVTKASLGVAMLMSRGHTTHADEIRAYTLLTEALIELWPLAQSDGPNGQLTAAQMAFARAMAWRSLAYRHGHTDASPEFAQNQIGVVGCEYHIEHTAGDHSSFYPREALNHGREGVVVIRAVFNGDGQVVNAQAAAAAPDEDFADSGAALIRTLSVTRNPDSAPNCVMPHQRFIVVLFGSD